MTAATMLDYYQARAREYEAIYARPERQADLRVLAGWLAREVAGRDVLEVACGTGYWTSVAAPHARSVLALDANPGPLEIARAKGLGEHVEFAVADAYTPQESQRTFDGAMAHFWWSHVPIGRQQQFLAAFTARLRPGARLLMIDNRYVAGSNTPVSRRDREGNTYQQRRLADGSSYEVVKNFPSPDELCAVLARYVDEQEVIEHTYFWAYAGRYQPKP